MACAIDHLRVDHRVTVLCDFTDLAGLTVRAGEAGVVRGLGLDFGRMEIWIELERNGARDTLRFALRATEGPRNGGMREYFEMGESTESRPIPVRSSEDATAKEPLHPLDETHARGGQRVLEKPQNSSDLSENRVACACDPALHRELWPARGELGVWACLCCGTVTCAQSFGDDGRFTGNPWQAYRVVALADPVRRWIAGWPRVKVDHSDHTRWPMSADFVRYPTLCYPADARCTDLDELTELEARLTREQAGQSASARLRATHRVDSGPPGGVPEPLRGYVMLWEALQLQPDSDVSVLLHLAQPRSPGCDLAAEVLRQRPDAYDLIVSSLRSADPTRRGVGFMIARDWHPADPRLAGGLIDLLDSLSFEPLPEVPGAIAGRGTGEMLLLLIAELKLATPQILSTLKALMLKLARHDAFLVDCVRIVLRELGAARQSPSRSA